MEGSLYTGGLVVLMSPISVLMPTDATGNLVYKSYTPYDVVWWGGALLDQC